MVANGPHIVGILLAAGRGRRFDPAGAKNKLLQPLDGLPVVVASARHLLAALPQVVAVVRADDDTTAGLLAALGCELVSFLLYRYAFDMSWQPHPWLLLLPLIGALLIGLAGVLGTRRALNASPLSVLREG